MGWFEEERAAAFHLALGIEDCPTPDDRGHVIDLLGDLLVIEHGCRIPRARYEELPGHRGLIMLPRGLTERQLDTRAFHEATHYLLKHGASQFFRQHGESTLAQVWEEREEREVEDFLLAFLIPARLAYLIRSDLDLAELTGCSVQLVQLRRERLRGRVVELTRPPAWCAYPHYVVTRWHSPSNPCLRIRSRRHGGPLYEVASSPDDIHDLTWKVNVELVALTLQEFEARYGSCRVAPEEDALIPLDQIRAWTRRVGQRRSLR